MYEIKESRSLCRHIYIGNNDCSRAIEHLGEYDTEEEFECPSCGYNGLASISMCGSGLSDYAYNAPRRTCTACGRDGGQFKKAGERSSKHRHVDMRRKTRDVHVFDIGGFRCALCGKSWTEMAAFEKHHIKPVSMGGEDSKKNLVALCRRCHVAVHRRIDDFTCAESFPFMPKVVSALYGAFTEYELSKGILHQLSKVFYGKTYTGAPVLEDAFFADTSHAFASLSKCVEYMITKEDSKRTKPMAGYAVWYNGTKTPIEEFRAHFNMCN